MTRWTGWLAVLLVAGAAALPLMTRLLQGKRAHLDAPAIRAHVLMGLAVAAVAFGHALTVVPALGSPEAITGGTLALAPGAAAFCVVVAHVGIGLQLRNPRLRERAKKRRLHLATASTIVILAAMHVGVLLAQPD